MNIRRLAKITRLDAPPCDAQAFAEWIKANAHLAFPRDNADADKLVVYASGEYTFIHSLVDSGKMTPWIAATALSYEATLIGREKAFE